MNFLDKFAEWGIEPGKLTNKKQQTDKKIEYVKDYIVRWSNISAVRNEISTITFIDCMSNAGVYQDGDCCTAIEVLNLFCDMANKYPNKTFQKISNILKAHYCELVFNFFVSDYVRNISQDSGRI